VSEVTVGAPVTAVTAFREHAVHVPASTYPSRATYREELNVMNVVRSRYKAGPIQIVKHFFDWDYLPDSVEERLKDVTPDIRWYANPEYTVTGPADAPLDQFVKQARRAQTLWSKRLSRTFGSSARRRMYRNADARTRQLAFTGLMFLEGVPQNPKAWPDVHSEDPTAQAAQAA
jgi:hypothetical protein